MILLIVEGVSTKVAVTVGDNAPLTSGKKTESISALYNVFEKRKTNEKTRVRKYVAVERY